MHASRGQEQYGPISDQMELLNWSSQSSNQPKNVNPAAIHHDITQNFVMFETPIQSMYMSLLIIFEEIKHLTMPAVL